MSEWENSVSTHGSSLFYTSSYRYDDEHNLIKIISDETIVNETWHFEEDLYLNQNGSADHAIGSLVVDGNMYRLMKNYTVDFHYNQSQQLTKMDIAEKRTNETGWEEPNALRWTAELEWTDGNLTKYSEYTNPDYPMISRSYTYYGGEIVDYQPILEGTTLRYYYVPLQYQGILGQPSEGLVKNQEIRNASSRSEYQYSYNLSTSLHDSRIEGYYESHNDKESKFTVIWVTK